MVGVRELKELLAGIASKSTAASQNRVNDVVKIAFNLPATEVVAELIKFTTRCGATHKLSSLYILDAMCRSSSGRSSPIVQEIEAHIDELFDAIFRAPSDDLERIKRVILLWTQNQTLSDEALDRILKISMNPRKQSTSSSGQHAASSSANASRSKPAPQASETLFYRDAASAATSQIPPPRTPPGPPPDYVDPAIKADFGLPAWVLSKEPNTTIAASSAAAPESSMPSWATPTTSTPSWLGGGEAEAAITGEVPQGYVKVLVKTIYISGLPLSATREALIQVFARFGSVRNVYMVQQKNVAFITFSERSEAERAVDQGSTCEMEGLRLTVRYRNSLTTLPPAMRTTVDQSTGTALLSADLIPSGWIAPPDVEIRGPGNVRLCEPPAPHPAPQQVHFPQPPLASLPPSLFPYPAPLPLMQMPLPTTGSASYTSNYWPEVPVSSRDSHTAPRESYPTSLGDSYPPPRNTYPPPSSVGSLYPHPSPSGGEPYGMKSYGNYGPPNTSSYNSSSSANRRPRESDLYSHSSHPLAKRSHH